MNNKMTVEIWSMCAAVNIKKALPLIEPLLTEQINIKTLAMKIERKYRNPAQWNKSVNERCLPAIKMILILQRNTRAREGKIILTGYERGVS